MMSVSVTAVADFEYASWLDRAALLEFVRPRHRALLATTRPDGGVEFSPARFALDRCERIVIATERDRVRTRNARRDPQVSVCVLSDDEDGPYVQIDGLAEVLDLADAFDLVPGAFRRPGINGATLGPEHSLIRIDIERWDPISSEAGR